MPFRITKNISNTRILERIPIKEEKEKEKINNIIQNNEINPEVSINYIQDKIGKIINIDLT